MLKVKATLKEVQELYKALGLVGRTTRYGNLIYEDSVKNVKYAFNPKTGLARRRTRSSTHILNSRFTVKNISLYDGREYKTRVRIPIFDLAELMSRAISPIVKYRQR
jgi:hypothetical protein